MPSFLTNPPFACLFLLFSSLHFWLCFSSLQSYLLLGLVDWWPSIHELLDIWPWRDLSPLVPDHTHRWDVNSLQKGLVATAVWQLGHLCILCMLHVFAFCMTIKTSALFIDSLVSTLGVIIVWNYINLLSWLYLDKNVLWISNKLINSRPQLYCRIWDKLTDFS